MHFDQLIVTPKEAGYTVVRLNRPHEMNAISRHMMDELKLAFNSLEDDPQVHVVILTGGDMVFCAGHDIKEMASLTDTEVGPYFKKMTDYMQIIYSFSKPVIAAVGGIALGGGFNLAVLCDLIIASESAIFGHPELRYGINPLLDPLRRVVGLARAKEITMMGEPVGAKEAFKLGFVNKVVPPERFMDVAESYARELTQRSPLVLQAIKRASDVVPRLDKRTALAYELEISTLLFSRSETKELISKTFKK
jgi:enoyl-CoA hydratase/carnithine racemase